MNEEQYEQYKTDEDFHEYVDRFRQARGLGIFEALSTQIVREVGAEYRRQKRDIIKG